jgi:YD repeat-containing protein
MSDDGYLAAIDEPGGAHREFSYDSSGLLQIYKKPNQATTSFTYDDMGRLVHEDMPGGGSWTLTRTGPTLDNVNAPVHVAAVSGRMKKRRSEQLGLGNAVSKSASMGQN